MLKRFVPILMLYSALAILLGHNFIPHQHQDFEQDNHSHHHNDGHHHDNETQGESNEEGEKNDWTHLFSNLQHGTQGITFLTSNGPADNFSKQIPTLTPLQTLTFVFQQVITEVRQNAPPHIGDSYNSLNYLPSGLRGPPISIV